MASSKNSIPSTDQSLGEAGTHRLHVRLVTVGSVDDPTAGSDPVTDPAFAMAKPYENVYFGK